MPPGAARCRSSRDIRGIAPAAPGQARAWSRASSRAGQLPASSILQRGVDAGVGGLVAVVQALGVDPEQHLDAVPGAYRRRRGMSQEVLAGLVGRTEDWLQRAENNRIQLDRLSVIRSLAEVLDVSIGDLVGEPMLLDWTADSRTQTVPALRAVLMDYSQLSPLLASSESDSEPPGLDQLAREVDDIFGAYQHSRFGYVTAQIPALLQATVTAARTADGDDAIRAYELLALSYQAAASVLTKLGEADLAWIAAERGLTAAQRTDNTVILGSLFRSVAHTLLATGRFQPAVQLVNRAAAVLGAELGTADGPMLSVYGSLFLTGAMGRLPRRRQAYHSGVPARSPGNRQPSRRRRQLHVDRVRPDERRDSPGQHGDGTRRRANRARHRPGPGHLPAADRTAGPPRARHRPRLQRP
jgi:transcriptional regulator with XRE-family HTH domain